MRVVLDSNVIIAAFAARGLCEALLERAFQKEFEFVLSDFIILEILACFEKKIKIPKSKTQEIEKLLRSEALIVAPVKVTVKNLRDRGDLPIIGTAVSGRAEFIITGDKDLLVLSEYEGIRILSPRAFMSL